MTIMASSSRRALASLAGAGAPRPESLIRVGWLNLRGSGLSILERLLLEECLLRHDDRNWLMAGTHEARPHRFLRLLSSEPPYISQADPHLANETSAIVLGLGGKPRELLNIDLVKREGCLCIKRFTGGGTVVLDPDSIWTTLIFRPPSDDAASLLLPESFPRPIMDWSAQHIFAPLFDSLGRQQLTKQKTAEDKPRGRSTLVLDTKSCAVENTGRVIQLIDPKHGQEEQQTTTRMPQFALRENDYVLGNDFKMGGNAQAIVKTGWLHHTSFLWDYQDDNMAYLTLPHKRPDYRQDRSHKDFLVKLRTTYPHLTKADFVTSLGDTVADASSIFHVEPVRLPEALQVVQDHYGGMQQWFDSGSRTRILHDL